VNELKPCPCCGSTARPVGSRSGINPHWKLCRVICDRCGLTTANHSTPEEAAAAWNTRATPPRAEVDVESVVRSVRATLAAWTHPGMSEHDRSVCVEQAIRRALARATGGNDAT